MHVVRTGPRPPPSSTRSAPYLLGLAVTLLGTVALVSAATGRTGAVSLVGATLVIAGALDAAGGRRARPTGRFVGDSLGGLLSIVAGLSLLASPWLGLRGAAVLLGLYLIASALVRGFAAVRTRQVVWGFPLVYAGVAALLGLLTLASFDHATALLLGAVAGMEIGARGVVLMAVSLELRRLDRTPA